MNQRDPVVTVVQPLGVHVAALQLALAPELALLDTLRPRTLLVLVEHAVWQPLAAATVSTNNNDEMNLLTAHPGRL